MSLFFLILGSSTACILILNRENNTISTANIGDSGYLVLRNGKVVHQSEEQTHYFNTPFQLSTPFINNVLRDQPESAQQQTFSVIDGDTILVATDGVFDNVPVSLLVDTLKQVRANIQKKLERIRKYFDYVMQHHSHRDARIHQPN